MSFSQRRFIGFRGHYEFDQKRVLLSTGNKIILLGLHPQSERPFKILSSTIPGLCEEDLLADDSSESSQGDLDDGSSIQQSFDSTFIVQHSSSQNDADEDIDTAPPKFFEILDDEEDEDDVVKTQEIIRPKEQILATTFLFDSLPSYVLVISKFVQPTQKDILNHKSGGDDSLEQQKGGIKLRILNLKTNDNSEEEFRNQGPWASASSVPKALEKKTVFNSDDRISY